MKRILLPMTAVLLVASLLVAQQASSAETAKTKLQEQVDEIMNPVSDVCARYWAREVQNGRITLQKLEEQSSALWLGTEKGTQALMASVRKYVAAGEPVSVTDREWCKIGIKQDKAFEILGLPRTETAEEKERNRQIRELEEPVFELDARYWAWRIAQEKDVTFEELEENSLCYWVGDPEYKRKLIDKIAENLRTGNTAKLTKKEEKRLEKVNKRVRKLLNKKK